MDKYRISYFTLIIRKFAERFNLSLGNSFSYLYKFGGIAYLSEFYDIEHTLPVEDTLDELQLTCKASGGDL